MRRAQAQRSAASRRGPAHSWQDPPESSVLCAPGTPTGPSRHTPLCCGCWVHSVSFPRLSRAAACCPLQADRNPAPCLATCCFSMGGPPCVAGEPSSALTGCRHSQLDCGLCAFSPALQVKPSHVIHSRTTLPDMLNKSCQASQWSSRLL